MRPLHAAIMLRIAWLALLIYGFAAQGAAILLFHALPFIGSAFLLWLGTRDREYHTLDALVGATFAAAIAVQLFMTWQTPGVLAFDKVFHALGGMCLAWFAAILYKPHVDRRWVAALAIMTFALAAGAAWEVFEWVMSLLPAPYAWPFNPKGLADSFGDLIADGAGAAIITAVELWRRRCAPSP